MKRGLLLICCSFIATVSLFAQTIDDMQHKSSELQAEIARLQQRIALSADDIKGQLNKYRMSQRLLANRQELIKGLDDEITLLNADIQKKNSEIVRLGQQRDELTGAYDNLLQQAYRHRDKKMWLMHVLSSESGGQAYRRWMYFKNYSDFIRDHVKRIKETEAQLALEKAGLKKLQDERVEARKKRQAEVDRMQSEQRSLDKNIKKLQQNDRQLKTELKKRRQEQDKLNQEIKKALAALEKKDAVKDEAAIKADRILSADFAKNKGLLPWPLEDAVVVERFGLIIDPKWGFRFDNKGVTLSGSKGADVKTVFNGVVASIWMDKRDSYLIRILVSHGEYSTIYCHMVDVTVKEGDKITTGQKLGTLSPLGEGISYFQLLHKSTPLNPAEWCR